MNDLKRAALELYKAPFYYKNGYVWDSNNQMVADDDAMDVVQRIRGWGRIGSMPDAEALQDKVGALVAEALTAYWDANSPGEVLPQPEHGSRPDVLARMSMLKIAYLANAIKRPTDTDESYQARRTAVGHELSSHIEELARLAGSA